MPKGGNPGITGEVMGVLAMGAICGAIPMGAICGAIQGKAGNPGSCGNCGIIGDCMAGGRNPA
jgi:hypothetical protein